MNKWVLVTGAAKRIGRAIALKLARSGWDIVVHYNTSCAEAEELAEKIQAMGRSAVLAEIDLLNTHAVENLIPALTQEIGPITALVNNASLFEPETLAPDNGRHTKINADAPRILGEALRKNLAPEQTGVIINILDTDPSKPDFKAYNVSKNKLRALTLETARNYAPLVRVNGVALGPVLQGPRESLEHFHHRSIAPTLLKIAPTPEAIAATARFLIENPFITGEIIHVDSGARTNRTTQGS